ncbi:unnamed protein product [Closterium sp. Yama58-4]|nr:unnamed protein product [Closterium sp. Yama58-4]
MPGSERREGLRWQRSGEARAEERDAAGGLNDGGNEGETDGEGGEGEGGEGEDDKGGEEGYRSVLEALAADFEVDLVQAPPALCSLADALPEAARRQLLGAYSPRFFPPDRTARLRTAFSAASASGKQQDGGCMERVRAACMRQWWQQEVQRTVQFVHAVRQCAASSPRLVLFLLAPHQHTGTPGSRGGARGGGGEAGSRGEAGGRGGAGGSTGVRVRERYDVAMERFVVRELRGRDWGVVSLAGRRPAPPPTAADTNAGGAIQTVATMDAGEGEEGVTAQAGEIGRRSHEGGSASVLRPVRGVQALLLRGEASHLLPLLAHLEQRFLEGPLEDLLISFFGSRNKSVHVHEPPLFWRAVGGEAGAGEEEGGGLGKDRDGVEEGDRIDKVDSESTRNWVQEGWAVEDPFVNEVKEPIRTALHPPAAPMGLSVSRSMLVSVHGGEVMPADAAGGVAVSGGGEGIVGSRGEGDDGRIRREGGGGNGTDDHKASAAGVGSGSTSTRAAVVLSPGLFACWVKSGGAAEGKAGGDERRAQAGEAEAQGKGGVGGLRGGDAGRGDGHGDGHGDDYGDALNPSPHAVLANAPEAPAGVTAEGVILEGVIRGEVVFESPLTEQGAAAWTMVAPRAVGHKGGKQGGKLGGKQGAQHGGKQGGKQGAQKDGHESDVAQVVVGQEETGGGAAAGWNGAGQVGSPVEEGSSVLVTIPITGRLFLPGIKDQRTVWMGKSFGIGGYTTVDSIPVDNSIAATAVLGAVTGDGPARLSAPRDAVRGTVQMEGALTWTDSAPGHARLAAEGVVLIERRENEEEREEERVWGAWRGVGVWGGARAGDGDDDRLQGGLRKGGLRKGGESSEDGEMRPGDADGQVGPEGLGPFGGSSTGSRRGGRDKMGGMRGARFVFEGSQEGGEQRADSGRSSGVGANRQVMRVLLGTSVGGGRVEDSENQESDGRGGSSAATETSGGDKEPIMLQLSCDGVVEYTQYI